MKWDKDIKTLLDRYYKGETTLDEEKYLSEFFLSDNVPGELRVDKDVFLALHSAANTEMLDDGFDEKLFAAIEAKKQNKNAKLYLTLSGIAAAAVILIAVWIGNGIFTSKNIYGTVTDPEIAFAQTRNALQLISAEMNRGLNSAGKAAKIMKFSFEKTDKPFYELQRLNKVERAVSLMQLVNVDKSNNKQP